MQSLSLTPQIFVSKGSGIGHLVLNQPEKFNAISYEMWQGIRTVVEDYSHDDGVRVIVVSGAGGKAFSAGADISQFEKQKGKTSNVKWSVWILNSYKCRSRC